MLWQKSFLPMDTSRGFCVGIFTVPFHIAADGIGDRCGDGLTCQQLGQGPVQVIDRRLCGIARGIYPAAGIDQCAVLVEHIKVRRSQRSIAPCYILCRIVQIGPRELVLIHSFDHVMV